MDIKQIKSLIERDRYDEAFAACEQLLRESPEKKADVLRTRAYAFAHRGDYGRAIAEREAVLAMGEGAIKDFFSGANYALSAGQLQKAVAWFNEVLRISDEQNETYFTPAAYFLLAYAQMKLGRYREAIQCLDKAVAFDDDIAMPIPDVCGAIDHHQLREEIELCAKSVDR